MNHLSKLRLLQSLWAVKQPYRLFHNHHQLLASQIIAHYEAINRCEKELPEYFNFPSDILDKWSQMEKVHFCHPIDIEPHAKKVKIDFSETVLVCTS